MTDSGSPATPDGEDPLAADAERLVLIAAADRAVCAVCNFLLNHVASQRYRAWIGGSIRYGLEAAACDERIARQRLGSFIFDGLDDA